VWCHTWRKNWVNCVVLTGNSAGLRTVLSSRLSHRELRSLLRESHTHSVQFFVQLFTQFNLECMGPFGFSTSILKWLWDRWSTPPQSQDKDYLSDNALHASEALFCSLPVRVDSGAVSYSLEGYRLDVWLVTCASGDRVYKQELPVSYGFEFRWIRTHRIWKQWSQMLQG